jgi:hypothetical protein
VYFNNVTLSGTTLVPAADGASSSTAGASGGSGGTVRFRLTISIGERLPPSPAPGSKQANLGKRLDPLKPGGLWWMQES